MASNELINFGMEPVTPSIIMVAGVGGAGSNAVNHMYELGIAQVSFMICNTDRQALGISPVPLKVKLGDALTEGLGAGNKPDRGRAAALESIDEISAIFRREGTRMVFITAGMGGGTGTGAAPVIAKAAREMGILTVGIVTLPFKNEGPVRTMHAIEGLENMKANVDALLVINNENIQELYGKLPYREAFGKADDILARAAKGIAEIITRNDDVNVDFADVDTVMRGSGVALMGSGRAAGEGRAMASAELSLNSPLLNHNNIRGAKNILLNISYNDPPLLMNEMTDIVNYVQEQAGHGANLIWGAGTSAELGGDIEVTIIATGFDMDEESFIGNFYGRARAPQGPVTPVVKKDDAAVATSAQGGDHGEERRFVPFERPHGTPVPKVGPAREEPPVRTKLNTFKRKDIYTDLDEKLEKPGYVRREVKLVISDSGGQNAPKVQKAVIREEAVADTASREASLFDQINKTE